MAEQSQNSGAVSNAFTKGMVKDYNESYQPEGVWTHARNAVNYSHDGQLGTLANEPANLKCVQLPYTLIGAIALNAGEWAVFTTDNTNSEIGIFTESTCTYTKVVNSACLGFKTSNLISGAYRRRFDCERVVYWDDGLNPSRYMDLDNPPFTYTDKIVDGCIQRTYTNQLDCERIRLAPFLTHPCLVLSKGKGAGTLANGSYQVCMAYTINQNRISDYIGLSNVQSLFSHQNISSSLELTITSIDKDFDEFELVVISTVNAQTVAKKMGYYSTSQGTIYIDTISPELTSVPLNLISLRTDPIEKSDAMYAVNNYLLRVGTYSKFQFNYQKLANKIATKWVAVKYPADYYYKGGNNPTFMRDEQYSFFIRWIYNTGERSASFHIPGREAMPSDRTNVIGGDAFETVDPDPKLFQTRQLWQVQNTATIDSLSSRVINDGGIVIATGKMGYWESTELYPADKPDIWAELCGKPIRHHKMPDETVDSICNHFTDDGKSIVILGVSFENISHPVDNYGVPISSIVGYEILKGSREGNKTIIAKGLMNNMREFNIPGTRGIEGLYQNYPYNDLRSDYYLTSDLAIIDKKLGKLSDPENPDFNIDDEFDREGIDADSRRQARKKLRQKRRELEEGDKSPGQINLSFPLSKYRKDYFSFHSPDTTFTEPFLGISDVKIYQEVYGNSEGRFTHPYKHPKFKTLTNFAQIFGSVISVMTTIGNFIAAFGNDVENKLDGTDKLPFSKKLSISKVVNYAIGGTFLGTGGMVPNPGIAASNILIGAYNLAMTIAMSYLEATMIGEQIINIIYGMVPLRQNAVQYDSHGFYNQSRINNLDNRRFRVLNASYIGPQIHAFDDDFRINNLFRSSFVALKLSDNVDDPVNIDDSRFRMSDVGGGGVGSLYQRNISGYYGALKVSLPSQYGQLESIKQIPISDCIHPALDPKTKYSTDVLFGGDNYINRFTEKNAFFFFNSWLMGEPDEFEFNYRNYMNIAYPRFWIDSSRLSFKLFGNASNTRHLDERESSVFFVSQGYFYLFFNGVRDFFVESEVNIAQRDWEDDISKRHYDFKTYVDYESLFRSDIIKSSNYYKYDYSLSINKLFNNFSSWGTILPRDYDPKIAETCYIYRPNNVVYSLPQESELKKDNWRMFLANNYKIFGQRITSIKSINKSGALFMMNSSSPVQFMGVDQLQTDAGVKITIGDGGLFSQPLQNLANSDNPYEYGSCQSRYSAIGTTYGVFWVSQNQGKVFQYAGQLDEISRSGMKYWFAKYLPSNLLKAFPSYPLYDNPVSGVGVQTIYDNTNEILYITKKDYKPKFNDLQLDGSRFYRMVNGVKTYYELTSEAFEDASWTISYDPKQKTWMSYHDWKPSFVLPGKTHFMTVNKDSIWKHNDRCDLFCNFYGKDYPFDIEFISSTGQTVTTMRSIEYFLDNYRYHNSCADRFHVLDYNFDQAIVYNSEQVSGLLNLELKTKVNPVALLSYPQIGTDSIKINYSKEEQKYRFNQFWDITKNRGEFNPSINIPMFNTAANGYEYSINPNYVDYKKPPLEHKRFRHSSNRVLLRRFRSGDVKMLFKVSNQKIQLSSR